MKKSFQISSTQNLERQQWPNKRKFILASISYSVGIGTFWRFPFLCYKNGGITFLIPYFMMIALIGVPMWLLEVGIGQMFQTGGITAWAEASPMLKGIGYGTISVAFILNCYYMVVIAWTFYYFINSIGTALPWMTCNNAWNTNNCWSTSNSIYSNESSIDHNSAIEFWKQKVLHMSNGIDDPAGLQSELAIVLLMTWIICYFCIWKGVRTISPMLNVTSILPYGILAILLVRGAFLPGSFDGLKYYLTPNLSKLFSYGIWMDAATQVFFSFGLGLGAMTTIGSYNNKGSNLYCHIFSIASIHLITSIVSGMVVFLFMGHLSLVEGIPISKIALSGMNLVFVSFPMAFSHLQWGPFWSALLFIMISLLGFGSQFMTVQAFVASIIDNWPKLLGRERRPEWFIALICLISYLIGLSMVTKGGIFVFQLFDKYGASSIVILFFCLIQSLAIGWIYRADRLVANIEHSIGITISVYFSICWKYLTPLISVVMLVFSVATFGTLKNGNTDFPMWSIIVGWAMMLVPILFLPIGMFLSCFKSLTSNEHNIQYSNA